MSAKSWIRLLVAAGAVVAVVLLGPRLLLASGHQPPRADRWLAESSARTALAQLIVGVGALAGGVYAARTFGLTRRNQQNERFAKAIENLGAPEARVRSGGVHTLHMLAREQDAFWDPVDDLLLALVRERLDGRTTQETTGFRDVQSALTALGSRRRSQGSPLPIPLDLSELNLSGFVLDRADLHRANLAGSTLDGVKAVDVILTEATLVGSTADAANLAGADLREADGSGAVWGTANLFNAKVGGLTCDGADLGSVRALTAEQIDDLTGTPDVAAVPRVT